MQVKGNYIDIKGKQIYPAVVTVKDGKIESIAPTEEKVEHYILPGFIDAHIHIESSMLVPSEFARMAVIHGTVATVSDPHEIANVLGVEGVDFMIDNGQKVPFKFNFGAPSCVPATTFETAGAVIDSKAIDALLSRREIKYLAEMMNYPGVLFNDEEVHQKLSYAKKHCKPVDGHAPGLRGEKAKTYIDAGISTDHECFTYDEAKEKLSYGMKVIIREGSAAKNFEALIDLLDDNYEQMMFCSDDKHPDDLMVGHINQLVARAIAKGKDKFKVLQAACLNPIDHYKLDVGSLKIGDSADFVVAKDLRDFEILATYINGELVAENGQSKIQPVEFQIINNFNTTLKQEEAFKIKAEGSKIRVIEALDGELITRDIVEAASVKDGCYVSNTQTDVLKMAVVNRYNEQPPAIAFIKGFQLKEGAIASCVGHDSHNIIVVGTDDRSICKAVN
ncbi:MAG: adenine deaminase, partial [Bacteroidetes bacterium]|nr:adenine deaminase [Bacteroidota bacterium]